MSFGPLDGVRIIEMAGIGPAPFAAMILADLGADVVRVERPGAARPAGLAIADPLVRGRTTVQSDLRDEAGARSVLDLACHADVLLEGFRPGVMERLGLGPERVLAENPSLVYGRMTGYGQDGPLAGVAGHDINYIALTGVLDSVRRRAERPVPPLSLVGDFGGGGMLLASGVLAALLRARSDGRGQVVDAAMVDGASLLATIFHGLRAAGAWRDEPGTNVLDTGAHFYDVYETADRRFVAVGAIEPQFYAELLDRLGLAAAEFPQWERDRWPELKDRLAEVFRSRTRAEWETHFDGSDACVSPVLSLAEASSHPHHVARHAFVDGLPAPAPRFSATPAARRESRADRIERVLARWAAEAR